MGKTFNKLAWGPQSPKLPPLAEYVALLMLRISSHVQPG